jgi:hypothetical protein
MKKIIFTLLTLFLLNVPLLQIFAYEGDMKESGTGKVVPLKNPLGDKINTPQAFIGQIIKGLLGVVGSVALIMFVYGGFTWLTSAGDKNKITKGRDTMLWATLGLTIIFSSYTLVRFVLEKVTG